MSFADRVRTGGVEHLDDPLLTAHVLGAEPKERGDRWVFSRKGGHCDAAYAAAGAVHLALILPPAPSTRVHGSAAARAELAAMRAVDMPSRV